MRSGPKYNTSVMTLKPIKKDKGHSVVKQESWTTNPYGFGERSAITCECGKRYSGYGARAYYSYSAHLRSVGVKP